MIENVEALSSKLKARAFGNRKPAVQRYVYDFIARAGDDIAAGIAERIWRWSAEGRGVKPMICGSLAGGQTDTLSRNDVRPIWRSGVRNIRPDVKNINRRSILNCYDAAHLPAIQERAQDRASR